MGSLNSTYTNQRDVAASDGELQSLRFKKKNANHRLLVQQHVHGSMPDADALCLHPHHTLLEREHLWTN